MVMASLVVLVAAALISVAYYRTREIAYRNIEQQMKAFSDRLAMRLQIVAGDTTALADALSSSDVLLTRPDERLVDKIAMFRGAILRARHIDGVYAGYPDGSFFHAVSLSQGNWRQELKAPAEAALALRIIDRAGAGVIARRTLFVDISGKLLGNGALQPTRYDPRLRPWYNAVGRSQDAVATGPYEMATTRELGMTISEAHRTGPGIVIGVDITLAGISQFLREELLTPGSVAFITDANGVPLIHSDPKIMSGILAAITEKDADPKSGTDRLTTTLIELVGAQQQATTFTVEGRQWLVMGTPAEGTVLFRGSRMVIAAPVDELMAPANRALEEWLILAAVVVAIGATLAVLVSGMLARSLQRLTAGATRLRELDFQTPVSTRSSVKEISTLGQAIDLARQAIQTFALFVPGELVRKGMQSGEFSSLAAVRKDVTAIFTDIYDFTTISEHHSPEDVVAMLSAYFEVLNVVVGTYHGIILQFLGDSIFAMWNAPERDERHAEHACRAALAMRDALCGFNEQQKSRGLPEFHTRIGINTGPALVGSVGATDRLQYTAMGDTINVASRLEGMNKNYGTSIIASAEVYRRCSHVIRFRPLGEDHVKGRESAIGLYEVVGLLDLSAAA